MPKLTANKPAGMTQRDWESTLKRREEVRRAAAYPQLVAALRNAIRRIDDLTAGSEHEDEANDLRNLLRQLGEA